MKWMPQKIWTNQVNKKQHCPIPPLLQIQMFGGKNQNKIPKCLLPLSHSHSDPFFEPPILTPSREIEQNPVIKTLTFTNPMAEILKSPNPQNQKTPFSPLRSPTSPLFLGSNNDQLERAQARAARAAAIRRKSLVAPTAPQPPPSDSCFSKEQITELFQNCIKLASENKINQKNTWELGLIDHLSRIIKTEAEEDHETNFQKASCTLEAGVKIYSMRVDSVHSEAYKVLGGINRAGRVDEDESTVEGDHVESGQEDTRNRKEAEKKFSPLSTLESSFDSLNVKKFDVAFAVDPLYHQTSAKFDEGGAKGLLLNNLGVYGRCRVVFDSFEVPGKSTHATESIKECNISDTIDISFAKDCIEQMLINIPTTNEISPTLRVIINQFDEENTRPPNVFPVVQKATEQVDTTGDNQDDTDDTVFDGCGNWSFDHDHQSSVVDENPDYAEPAFGNHQQESDSYTYYEPDADRSDNIAEFLFLGMGSSNGNAWAGPDHWKFRKVKGVQDKPAAENGSPVTNKKRKSKKQAESDIDFTKCLDKELPDIFVPPKNPKSLLLPANRVPCKTILPEDCHYQPEDLVKLFLRPDLLCLGKRARQSSDESVSDAGPLPSWDNDNAFNDNFDDGDAHSDVEDPSALVSQPRQVNKIEVQYDKTSKQVDVHALKGTLWNHMQESLNTTEEGGEGSVSFRDTLSTFPDDCKAAACEDISPHLCFICLLHLANEHGLSITGTPDLDDLNVHFAVNS